MSRKRKNNEYSVTQWAALIAAENGENGHMSRVGVHNQIRNGILPNGVKVKRIGNVYVITDNREKYNKTHAKPSEE
jgi:hypothetical protein